MTEAIPVSAGKRIADDHGYDQVVIVARKVGGPEHVTTYGVDKAHCGVAARMGDFFKHKLMGWPREPQPEWPPVKYWDPGAARMPEVGC